MNIADKKIECVMQHEYRFSNDPDVDLVTYGIAPCLGISIRDKNDRSKRIVAHLSMPIGRESLLSIKQSCEENGITSPIIRTCGVTVIPPAFTRNQIMMAVNDHIKETFNNNVDLKDIAPTNIITTRGNTSDDMAEEIQKYAQAVSILSPSLGSTKIGDEKELFLTLGYTKNELCEGAHLSTPSEKEQLRYRRLAFEYKTRNLIIIPLSFEQAANEGRQIASSQAGIQSATSHARRSDFGR